MQVLPNDKSLDIDYSWYKLCRIYNSSSSIYDYNIKIDDNVVNI